MKWHSNRSTNNSSSYSATLSSTTVEGSRLLGKKKSHFVNSLMSKVATFMAVIMMFGVVFAGATSNAPPAQANMLQDIVDNMLCSNGMLGYGYEEVGIFKANTVKDDKNTKANSPITPYEKYGYEGLNYTSWLGFANDDKSVKDEGKQSSRGIIKGSGNPKDSGLEHMFNTSFNLNKEENRKQQPGLVNVQSACSSFNGNYASATTASWIFAIGKASIWVSGMVYQVSAESSSNIYTYMEKPITNIVKKLKTDFYFEYFIVMIMIMALWVAYKGLIQRRSREAFGGILWAIIAAVVSVAFMTNPTYVPEKMNEVVSGISQGAMKGVTSASNPNIDICQIKGSVNDGSNKKMKKSQQEARNNIRGIQCNLWYTFAYTPWTMGQFGGTPDQLNSGANHNEFMASVGNKHLAGAKNASTMNFKDPIRRVSFGSNTPKDSAQNWALYYLDSKVNWAHDMSITSKENAIRQQISVTANELYGTDYNKDFKGENGANRVTAASLATISAVGAGAMIVVISMSIIILDLGVIILTLVAPVFALAGLHPGAGRGIAMGWVENLLKMGLKRIALSMFLAVMIAIFGAVMMNSGEMEWIISMILVLAVAFGGLSYRKQIGDAFSSFSLGGQGVNKMPIIGQQKMAQQKDNLTAMATGGMMGRNSSVGQYLNGKKENRRWDKRISGTATRGSGSAGTEAPSRRDQRRKDREEAAARTSERYGSTDQTGDNGGKPDGSGAGAAPKNEHDTQQHDTQGSTESPDTSGAGPNPQGAPETGNQTRSGSEGNTESSSNDNPDISGAGSEPQSKSTSSKFARKERAPKAPLTPEQVERRRAKEFKREEDRLLRQSFFGRGTGEKVTPEVVNRSIQEKAQVAANRRNKLKNGIDTVKTKKNNFQTGASNWNQNRKDVRQKKIDSGQHFATGMKGAATELKNMSKAFNEDTNNRYNPKKYTKPIVDRAVKARKESVERKKDFKNEVANVKQERKDRLDAHKKEVKRRPRGIVRKAYVKESQKYLDKNGNIINPRSNNRR